VFDEFNSLSPAQRHHAKTYATGLVAANNKTMAGIEREVLRAEARSPSSREQTRPQRAPYRVWLWWAAIQPRTPRRTPKIRRPTDG